MAKPATRAALTLPADLRAVLEAFAEASGKPMSTVIVDLLQEMAPQLVALTKIQRQVKAGQHSAAKQTLRHMMGDAMADVIAESQPELFTKKSRK